MYRWYCIVVGVTPGLAVAAGGQVASRAPGVCPAPPLCGCGRSAPVVSFPGVRVQSHAFIWLHSGLLGAMCVALFPLPPCALVVSCGCWLFGALFVCSRSCVVGPRLWAGSLSWSVPFGVSCCSLRFYTYSPYCVSLFCYKETQ